MKNLSILFVAFLLLQFTTLAQEGWFEQTSGTTEIFKGVSFTDSNNGTIVGGHGIILRTTNGGTDWISQSSGTSNHLWDVSITNVNTGTAVGQGSTILRTTNGGTTWTQQTSGITQDLIDVSFIDENTGTVVGFNGKILRTTDGGVNWIQQTSGIINHLWGVSFTDSNNGAAVGEYTILRTTDGGVNWIQQTNPTTYYMVDVFFTDANTGTVVGENGTILRTTDGGVNWIQQTNGSTDHLFGVCFTDADNGTAVGYNGTILRTTNGGTEWISQYSGTANHLSGISFTDANTGTVVGDSGTILRTTNGGVTPVTFPLTVSIDEGWNMVSIPGLHPVNQNVTTWWTGLVGDVFKFENAYISVDTATPGEGYWMNHLDANVYNTGDEWPADGIDIVSNDPISADSGWNMIGGYKDSTVTSGLTTTPPGLISGPAYSYSSLSGYVPATNLVPGYGYWIKLTGAGSINIPSASLSKGSTEVVEYIQDDWGKITITDNAGRSYTLYAVNGEVDLDNYELPPMPPVGMFDIRFGSDRIAEDINSSIQSIEMSGVEHPVRVRVENMSITLQDESGNNINTQLIPGEEITIINSSINKLLVSSGEVVAPIEYALEQNYPNPFNPTTKIKYSIPQSSNVVIKVFDILGNEIETLVNEEKQTGTYEITWTSENLSSGIYFYRLQAGDFVETKKMVLMK